MLTALVRFEVSTAVTMIIIIFWEMTPCGSYKNRRFGGSYRLHIQGVWVQTSTERVVSSCIDSDSYTLKMEAIRSSETSVLIRATRQYFPEDDKHHSHRRGNLKSYNLLLVNSWNPMKVENLLSGCIISQRSSKMEWSLIKEGKNKGKHTHVL
jgi:hypothetical protein